MPTISKPPTHMNYFNKNYLEIGKFSWEAA